MIKASGAAGWRWPVTCKHSKCDRSERRLCVHRVRLHEITATIIITEQLQDREHRQQLLSMNINPPPALACEDWLETMDKPLLSHSVCPASLSIIPASCCNISQCFSFHVNKECWLFSCIVSNKFLSTLISCLFLC